MENHEWMHLFVMQFMKLSILNGSVVTGVIFSFIVFQYYSDPKSAILLSLLQKCETCENAKQLAEADFKNETYRLVYSGYESNGREMLASILKEDYNITTFWTGCISFSELNCYHYRMTELLAAKYGCHFFDKALERVKLQATISKQNPRLSHCE
jgi:hypothetical protein